MRKLLGFIFFTAFVMGCTQTNEEEQESFSLEIFKHKNSFYSKGSYSDSLKVGLWDYERSMDTITWQAYYDSVLNLALSIPVNYTVKKDDRFLFFANKNYSNDYIACLAYSREENFNLNDYLLIIKDQVMNLNDSILVFDATEMSVESQNAVFSYFQLLEGVDHWVFMSLYLEKEDYVYDITYKFHHNDELVRNQIIFWDFIFNLRLNNRNLVDKEELKIKIVK